MKNNEGRANGPHSKAKSTYQAYNPKPSSKPQDAEFIEGQCLAAIPRGATEELRLSLDGFGGHPFLNLRLWAKLNENQWVPTRKGLSIRLSELPELLAGLEIAFEKDQAFRDSEAGNE